MFTKSLCSTHASWRASNGFHPVHHTLGNHYLTCFDCSVIVDDVLNVSTREGGGGSAVELCEFVDC